MVERELAVTHFQRVCLGFAIKMFSIVFQVRSRLIIQLIEFGFGTGSLQCTAHFVVDCLLWKASVAQKKLCFSSTGCTKYYEPYFMYRHPLEACQL